MAEEEPSDPSLDSSQSPVAESKVEDMPPALDSDADDRSSDQEAGGEDTEDLLDALEEVKGKPCKVTELEVTGFQRTKPDVVARELEGVRNATTLEEIKEELLEALVAFQELDVFSEVTVDVEKPKEVLRVANWQRLCSLSSICGINFFSESLEAWGWMQESSTTKYWLRNLWTIMII